jgi:hypothetical protein
VATPLFFAPASSLPPSLPPSPVCSALHWPLSSPPSSSSTLVPFPFSLCSTPLHLVGPVRLLLPLPSFPSSRSLWLASLDWRKNKSCLSLLFFTACRHSAAYSTVQCTHQISGWRQRRGRGRERRSEEKRSQSERGWQLHSALEVCIFENLRTEPNSNLNIFEPNRTEQFGKKFGNSLGRSLRNLLEK